MRQIARLHCFVTADAVAGRVPGRAGLRDRLQRPVPTATASGAGPRCRMASVSPSSHHRVPNRLSRPAVGNQPAAGETEARAARCAGRDVGQYRGFPADGDECAHERRVKASVMTRDADHGDVHRRSPGEDAWPAIWWPGATSTPKKTPCAITASAWVRTARSLSPRGLGRISYSRARKALGQAGKLGGSIRSAHCRRRGWASDAQRFRRRFACAIWTM